MKKEKKIWLISALAMLALNAAAYGVYHLSYALPYWEYYADWQECVLQILLMLLECAIPALICAMASNARRVPLSLLAFTLTRGVYYLPYNYIYFMELEYEFTTATSILLSLGKTLLIDLPVFFALLWILTLLSDFVCRRIPTSYKPLEARFIDTANESSLRIMVVSTAIFVYTFVRELIEVITYLVEYSNSWRVGEIIYVAVTLVAIVLSWFLTQALSLLALKAVGRRLAPSNAEK